MTLQVQALSSSSATSSSSINVLYLDPLVMSISQHFLLVESKWQDSEKQSIRVSWQILPHLYYMYMHVYHESWWLGHCAYGPKKEETKSACQGSSYVARGSHVLSKERSNAFRVPTCVRKGKVGFGESAIRWRQDSCLVARGTSRGQCAIIGTCYRKLWFQDGIDLDYLPSGLLRKSGRNI